MWRMSRIEKEAQIRIDGMEYALRRIKEIGIEEFEKELKWRGNVHFGLQLNPRELLETADSIIVESRVAAMLVLHDEFDFGRKRIERFNSRFNDKMEGLNKSYVTWGEYLQIMHDELGIKSYDVQR